MDNSALVSLTFDDGLRCQFEQALPILNQYGFPATFFLIANQAQTHDLWAGHTDDWWKIDWRDDDIAMLKKVIQNGHEIGGHSVTHHPTQIKDPKRSNIEASDSKRLIKGWLGTEPSSFAYPFYWSHAYLANAVRSAGYEQARGGGTAPRYLPQASYYTIPHDEKLDGFNVDCRQISRTEDVGGWIHPGCWQVLTFHGIGSERDGWEPITVAEFTRQMTELAKHRDSGAVEIVTFHDGARPFRSY